MLLKQIWLKSLHLLRCCKGTKGIICAKENDKNVSEDNNRYRICEDEAPMKRVIGYKVFRYHLGKEME